MCIYIVYLVLSYAYIRIYTYIYTLGLIYKYSYIYHVHIYTHLHMHMYLYIYLYTHKLTLIHIYTHTYTYTYTYTRIYRSDAQSAERCLEQALSYDFSIRSHIYYRILYTYIYSIQGKYTEAIMDLKALTTEISDLYTTTTHTNNSTNTHNNTNNTHSNNSNNNIQYYNTMRISDEEYLNVYILLGYIYGRTKHIKESELCFTTAKNIFIYDNKCISILLLSSALYSIDRKQYDTALNMINKIPTTSYIYTKSQYIKANIYLYNLYDKDSYIKIFQNLVEYANNTNSNNNNNTTTTTNIHTTTTSTTNNNTNSSSISKADIQLGEAYLRIIRPVDAVVAFEKAYNIDKSNIRLR